MNFKIGSFEVSIDYWLVWWFIASIVISTLIVGLSNHPPFQPRAANYQSIEAHSQALDAWSKRCDTWKYDRPFFAQSREN